MSELEQLVNGLEHKVPERVKKIIDYAQTVNKV